MIKMNKNRKRKLMAALYAVFISFILLSMSSFLAEDYIKTNMKDKYDYHLIYRTDGKQSHYYVERYDKQLDGKIDLTYTTATHTLEVNAKNIRMLHIDCKSMYNDESMKVFGIDGSANPNYYKRYFIEHEKPFKVIIESLNKPINNLTFKYTPVPVKVIVNGQEWWKAGINYTYNGEDIVFTKVPNGHTEVKIYFKEDEKLKLPIAAFTVKILGPKTVKFDATTSMDPDGKIEDYLWDFGDGSFSIDRLVTKDYAKYGNYTVILTVIDNDDYKDMESKIIILGKDTDGDGMPDKWEVKYGLAPDDPTGNNGADGDPDNDGYPNLEEYKANTNPIDGTDYPAEKVEEKAKKRVDSTFYIVLIIVIVIIIVLLAIILRLKRKKEEPEEVVVEIDEKENKVRKKKKEYL